MSASPNPLTNLLDEEVVIRFATRALSRHTGDYLVYVGEGAGGCTGDRLFHRLLDRVYVPVLSHPVPTWPGLHDYATIYKRKGR